MKYINDRKVFIVVRHYRPVIKKYSKLEVAVLYEHDQIVKSTNPDRKKKETEPKKAQRKKERYLFLIIFYLFFYNVAIFLF